MPVSQNLEIEGHYLERESIMTFVRISQFWFRVWVQNWYWSCKLFAETAQMMGSRLVR